MTDKPTDGQGPDQPDDELGKDFADLTPKEFLDKTADNEVKEPAASQDDAPASDDAKMLAERTEDLQRLQAEYVNYRRRVERDRDMARHQGTETVIRDLMPVFDAIKQAEAHGELTGGFKLVADELNRLAERRGLVIFGAPGEEFDPRRHEALMQVPVPGDGEMCIHEVMQQGFELDGNLVRPARVVVGMPTGEPAPADDQADQAGEGSDAQSGDDQASQAGNDQASSEPAGDDSPHDDTDSSGETA